MNISRFICLLVAFFLATGAVMAANAPETADTEALPEVSEEDQALIRDMELLEMLELLELLEMVSTMEEKS